MMAAPVSGSKTLVQTPLQPLPIRREIPGSNIQVFFTVSRSSDKKRHVQAQVVIGKETKPIPNVPIEGLTTRSFQQMSLKQALQMLKTCAIDYLCEKVVFLPKSSLELIEEWRKNKSAEHPDAKANKSPNLDKLTRSAKYIKKHFKHNKSLLTAKVCEAYYSFGLEYFFSTKYREALLFFQELYQMTERIRHIEMMAHAHSGLKKVYHALGESDRAISHHTQKHKLRFFLKDLEIKENELKSLKIEKNKNTLIELGIRYGIQDDYKKAIEILEFISNRDQESGRNYNDEFNIYTYRGFSYAGVGRDSEAEKSHLIGLEIAEEAKDSELILVACCNLLDFYMAKNMYREALEQIEPIRSLLSNVKEENFLLKGRLFSVLGRFFCWNEKGNPGSGDKQLSFRFHENHIRLAAHNKNELIFAYGQFGNTYVDLEQWTDAIKCYKEAIRNSENAKESLLSRANLYHSLGCAHFFLGNYEDSKNSFLISIDLLSDLLRENCQNNLQWQISFFEKQFRPYRMLEKVVLRTDKDQALLVADSSRSRSLLGCLKDKLQQPVTLSLKAIKDLATSLKTTFVLYSCCDPFGETWCWVMSAENVIFRKLSIVQIAPFENRQAGTSIAGEELQRGVSQWIAKMEDGATRSPDDSTPFAFDQDQLKKWYTDFISPIEDLLPRNGERLTFIPDAALHKVPFALFQNDKGEYLFEKWTPIIAPSIETLLCLEKLDKENLPSRKRDSICTITCSQAHEQFGLNQLVGVDEEKKHVHDCFTNYEELDPVVESIKEMMTQFGHIHIACHGLSDEKENEHSVFEGALALTDPQPLYSEDIIKLSLNASLVFMSACSSGHGKRFREGSIGLPFACLAGGASSVIATLWSISDAVTPKIVEKFYEHYLGQTEEAQAALAAGKPFGQAEALREAMLFAKQVFPDKPYIWGAFFLTGLPGNIRDKGVFAELGETIRLDPDTRVWTDKDNILLFSLKGGKMTTTQVFKDGTRKEFPEERITASLKNFAQRRSGIPQKTGELNHWSPEEKEELFRALLVRKIIVNKDRIAITASPKK